MGIFSWWYNLGQAIRQFCILREAGIRSSIQMVPVYVVNLNVQLKVNNSNTGGSFYHDLFEFVFESLRKSPDISRKQILRTFFFFLIMKLYVVCTH